MEKATREKGFRAREFAVLCRGASDMGGRLSLLQIEVKARK
jgi:hypothetical protein